MTEQPTTDHRSKVNKALHSPKTTMIGLMITVAAFWMAFTAKDTANSAAQATAAQAKKSAAVAKAQTVRTQRAFCGFVEVFGWSPSGALSTSEKGVEVAAKARNTAEVLGCTKDRTDDK